MLNGVIMRYVQLGGRPGPLSLEHRVRRTCSTQGIMLELDKMAITLPMPAANVRSFLVL